MKKKTTPLDRILINLNNLIPFVGLILVIAGIIGLIFVQNPLQQSQDNRSEASVITNTHPEITSQDSDFYVDEEAVLSLYLNAPELKVQKIDLFFNIEYTGMNLPEVVVNDASGFTATEVESNSVDDGYIVHVTAEPNNLDWFVAPTDISFIKIKFKPTQTGSLSINFDEDKSVVYVTNGRSFAIGDILNFNIISRDPVVCATDTQQCSNGTYVSRDENNDCEFRACTPLSACNESCTSSSFCEVGHRCYNTGDGNKCRLATNSSSTSCQPASDEEVTYRQCNQSCSSSRDCKSGLTCFDSSCRNPKNVDSSNCSNLTTVQETASIASCGETCSTNADCAVNLRCYNSECRLASNPSSLSCSAETAKTVTAIYDNKDSDIEGKVKPIKKGDSLIPKTKLKLDPVDTKNTNSAVGSDLNDRVSEDETALDLIISMLKNKQQALPMVVIFTGIGLLILSILVILIKKMRQNSNKYAYKKTNKDQNHINLKTHKVSPGSDPVKQAEYAQSTRVKNLMMKLNDETNEQNQG